MTALPLQFRLYTEMSFLNVFKAVHTVYIIGGRIFTLSSLRHLIKISYTLANLLILA